MKKFCNPVGTAPDTNNPSVLHLTFNMGIGGTEQVIFQLISALTKKGVSSEIVCIDGHVGAIGEKLQALGVKIHILQRSGGVDRSLISALRDLIKKRGYDILHCHQYTPYFYGVLASLGTKCPVVFTEHGRFHPDRYRYKAILINPLLALATSAIVAISKATRLALARYEFIPKRKIQVIYNGIVPINVGAEDRSRLRNALGLSTDTYVLGTVSRLDPVKNQAMMIDAFSIFAKQHEKSVLLIVGDGPEREALEKKVKGSEVEARVLFTGFINNPQVHLAIMDQFLLSSFTEGTSMTLLEAMSLGKPIVATRVGGNPEIVEDRKTGLLVKSDDAMSFAQAMMELKTDQMLADSFSAQAKSRFDSSFSAESMANNYLRVYLSVIPGRKVC